MDEIEARLDYTIEHFKIAREQLDSKIPLNEQQKVWARELVDVYTQQINLLESIKYGDEGKKAEAE